MMYNQDNVADIPSVDLLTFLFGATPQLPLNEMF